MKTKQNKTTSSKRQQTSKAGLAQTSGNRSEGAEASCTGAWRSAKPMSAEEFLQQLEAQRTPKTNTDAEKLAEKIVVAATPRAPTNVPVGGGRRAHQIIKLGIDVHLDRYVVVRQIDGSFPV